MFTNRYLATFPDTVRRQMASRAGTPAITSGAAPGGGIRKKAQVALRAKFANIREKGEVLSALVAAQRHGARLTCRTCGALAVLGNGNLMCLDDPRHMRFGGRRPPTAHVIEEFEQFMQLRALERGLGV